jgi:hypothetical protein
VCRFNREFEALSKQKHADAERLMDLGSSADELIRGLVMTHLLLNPGGACAGLTPADDSRASAADVGGEAAVAAPAGDGSSNTASTAQLSADLGAGRLVPHWSPDEDLAGDLLTIKPHEVQACKFIAPAERAKAAAQEAAAEAAGKAAAADSSRDRALQQARWLKDSAACLAPGLVSLQHHAHRTASHASRQPACCCR